MSVSLLLLPWASRHPSFLFGLPLLAVTPVVGQGVRPILKEALMGLLKGLRISTHWLAHHEAPDAHGHGHGHSHAHHQQQHVHHHAPHGPHHAASGGPARASHARIDPRTVPHAGAGAAYVEPSGPYSEWRPPAERRMSSGSMGPASGSPQGSPSGSALSSRDGGYVDRRHQQQSQPALVHQQQHHQQQQQQHVLRRHLHSLHTVASKDNLESIEEEEEAMWAAAAASLERNGSGHAIPATPQPTLGASSSATSGASSGGRHPLAGVGSGSSSSLGHWEEAETGAAAAAGAGGHHWQSRDPRVLSHDEKMQRLVRQQQQQQRVQ